MGGQVQRDMAIEALDLRKRFGEEWVLQGVSFAVPRGQTTVLIGPSGAGKTVTIKHILGLFEPTEGEVLIAGRNVAQMSPNELKAVRNTMGVVLQGTLPFTCGLIFSMNIFENIAEPLRYRRQRWNEDKITEVTLRHLESVGLRDRAQALPAALSSGMAKRAAIARALALEPEVIIIDDFDSGIDGIRLRLLSTMLRDYQLDTGATLFLSTHDMGAAQALADHLAVINDGRTVISGPADDVFASDDETVREFLARETVDFTLPPP